MAFTNAMKEAIWLQQLCKDIYFTKLNQLLIFFNNQHCIALIQTPKFYARTKHVENHHHFVREKVLSGDVEINNCNTKEQYEDFSYRKYTST